MESAYDSRKPATFEFAGNQVPPAAGDGTRRVSGAARVWVRGRSLANGRRGLAVSDKRTALMGTGHLQDLAMVSSRVRQEMFAV